MRNKCVQGHLVDACAIPSFIPIQWT